MSLHFCWGSVFRQSRSKKGFGGELCRLTRSSDYFGRSNIRFATGLLTIGQGNGEQLVGNAAFTEEVGKRLRETNKL